jgi:hypothetical protein
MTLAIGGSWDGKDWPGLPFEQRLLVLFVRNPDGSQDLNRSETYARKERGGKWFFLHAGTKTPEDGSWSFPEPTNG